MSPSARRSVFLASAALVVWYLCVLLLWAVQPLSDAVPIGVDYSLKSPRQVSQVVECNTLFAESARDSSPLPVLNPQPADKPPLTYSREACVDVQRDARIIFALNTVFVAVALIGVFLVVRRLGRQQPPTPPSPSGPMELGASERASMATSAPNSG